MRARTAFGRVSNGPTRLRALLCSRRAPQVEERGAAGEDERVEQVAAKVQHERVQVQVPALGAGVDAERLGVKDLGLAEYLLQRLRELGVELLRAAALKLLRADGRAGGGAAPPQAGSGGRPG